MLEGEHSMGLSVVLVQQASTYSAPISQHLTVWPTTARRAETYVLFELGYVMYKH